MDNPSREIVAAIDAMSNMAERTADALKSHVSSPGFASSTGDDKAKVLEKVTALVEHAREVRATVPLTAPATETSTDAWNPPLPFNRKERYFTGTVLPMVVASDGFAHLHRLLELAGLTDVDVNPGRQGGQKIQFFTEYGFAESVFTPEDREKWPELGAAQTPDVVIAGPDWLLAIEAKMFHAPSAGSLANQMQLQSSLIDVWRSTHGLDDDRVKHVLLLPSGLASTLSAFDHSVITWEQVAAAYRQVAPRFWLDVLDDAIARYDSLVSKSVTSFGANQEAKIPGALIAASMSDGSFEYLSVGRNGGLRGSLFQEDVATGRWRSQKYEVSSLPPANSNWFLASEFVTAVGTR